MKRTIILVGDYNRNDFNYIAKELRGEIDFYFLEYLNPGRIKNKDVYTMGTPIFWKDFHDACEMIEKIKPEKVLFYFIETYNHVALNVACKVKKIPTFHIDHGLRLSLDFYEELNQITPDQRGGHKDFKDYINISKEFIDRIKNRRFFFKTLKHIPTPEAKFLKEYYKIRRENNIFETFKKVNSEYRLADSYISFSPKVFESYVQMDHLPSNYPVNFIGVPVFDDLANFSKNNSSSGKNLLFIDQPMAERNVPGWTLDFKEKFLDNLVSLSEKLGIDIYIKPHPLNDLHSYETIKKSNRISIISGFTDNLLKNIGIILSFSSTLLMPFMAMDEKVVFIFELKSTGNNNTSPFTKYFKQLGPVDVIYNFEDLKGKIRESDTYLEKQKKLKGDFTKKWLYKFDGQSTNRLKALLLNPNSNF